MAAPGQTIGCNAAAELSICLKKLLHTAEALSSLVKKCMCVLYQLPAEEALNQTVAQH
jgi:hypothetical protein